MRVDVAVPLGLKSINGIYRKLARTTLSELGGTNDH